MKDTTDNSKEIKLLLIEDDEDFRCALIMRFEKRGYDVVAAPSGEEGLEMLRSSTFDVIVTDIKLPGIDGIEVLDKIRSINTDIPVILLTGYASLDSAQQAVKLNATDYLLKPLESIDELLQPINNAVYSYKLFRENERLSDAVKLKIREIERSEKKYRNLFTHASDIIFTIDTAGTITSLNKKMEEALQYTAEDIIGQNFFDFMLPDDKSNIRSSIDRMIAGEKIDKMEIVMTTMDKRQRLGEMGIAPIRNGNTIEGLQCIVHDITERKRIEKVLKESEAQLRSQKEDLERKNIALKEVLTQIEIEKQQIKDDVVANIEELLMPNMLKLRSKVDSTALKYLDLIHKNLESLVDSFGRRISDRSIRLTPKEIEICNMIKSGLSSKEIANLLHLSLQTIERHRNNIRKKLDIVNKSVNLITYLKSIGDPL